MGKYILFYQSELLLILFFYLFLSRSTSLYDKPSKPMWQNLCPPEQEASSKMSYKGAYTHKNETGQGKGFISFSWQRQYIWKKLNRIFMLLSCTQTQHISSYHGIYQKIT